VLRLRRATLTRHFGPSIERPAEGYAPSLQSTRRRCPRGHLGGINQKLQQEAKTKDAEIAKLKTRLEKLEIENGKITGELR